MRKLKIKRLMEPLLKMRLEGAAPFLGLADDEYVVDVAHIPLQLEHALAVLVESAEIKQPEELGERRAYAKPSVAGSGEGDAKVKQALVMDLSGKRGAQGAVGNRVVVLPDVELQDI